MHTDPIRITKRYGAGLIAEGPHDELAAALLRRAGFLPISTPRSSWWRAPYDLDTAEENEIASAAYDMLTSARYPVTIAPELRSRPTAAAREVTAMGSEIIDSASLDTVTALLSTVSDAEHGTLTEVTRLLDNAAHWITVESALTYRDGPANHLIHARRAVETAQEHLESAVDALASVPEPMRGRHTPRTARTAATERRVAAAGERSSALASGTFAEATRESSTEPLTPVPPQGPTQSRPPAGRRP